MASDENIKNIESVVNTESVNATSDELLQLKKELANEVVSKMLEQNPELPRLAKWAMTEFLVDSNTLKDKFRDVVIWLLWDSLWFITPTLEKYREMFGEVKTKRDLETLKTAIFNEMSWVSQAISGSSESNETSWESNEWGDWEETQTSDQDQQSEQNKEKVKGSGSNEGNGSKDSKNNSKSAENNSKSTENNSNTYENEHISEEKVKEARNYIANWWTFHSPSKWTIKWGWGKYKHVCSTWSYAVLKQLWIENKSGSNECDLKWKILPKMGLKYIWEVDPDNPEKDWYKPQNWDTAVWPRFNGTQHQATFINWHWVSDTIQKKMSCYNAKNEPNVKIYRYMWEQTA